MPRPKPEKLDYPECGCGCGVRIRSGTDLVQFGELGTPGEMVLDGGPYRHECAMRIFRERFGGAPYIIAMRRKMAKIIIRRKAATDATVNILTPIGE